MLFNTIDLLFKFMSYSMIIYGLWLLTGAPFLVAGKDWGLRRYRRFRRVRKARELASLQDTKHRSRLFLHLELILSSGMSTLN